jgi:transposase, IS30 family
MNSLFRDQKLPLKTITNDNGKEFMDFEKIERTLGAKVYFTTPFAPWEKGTNENTNGLIREYFPKKTNFSQISESEIKEVERILNLRPRKILNYQSPYEVLNNVRKNFFDCRESRTRSVKAPLSHVNEGMKRAKNCQ